MPSQEELIEDLIAEQLRYWADGFIGALEQITYSQGVMLAKLRMEEAVQAGTEALRTYGLKKEEEQE